MLAAIVVLCVVFRTFVATMIPIFLALTALATAFLLLFIMAGLTDINTITPILVSMIGLGVGIDYSLFIVTRFRQLLHEGLSPATPPPKQALPRAGRAVRGITVAISVSGLAFFGLDFVTKLGIGGPSACDQRADREFAVALGAEAPRPQDRPVESAVPASDGRLRGSREKTLIARWGRFVTAHARPVFRRYAADRVVGTTSGSCASARGQGTQPKEQTAEERTTCSRRVRTGFNGPIPIVVDVNSDNRRRKRSTTACRASKGSPRSASPS